MSEKSIAVKAVALPSTAESSAAADSPEQAAQVLIREHLQEILANHLFRSSERCRRFLTYIVERTLAGEEEDLKERRIGVEVFHRPADYNTGDHPIVRITASEVRRRLIQFYAETGAGTPPVRIELPVGAYRPHFRYEDVLNPKPQPHLAPVPVSARPQENPGDAAGSRRNYSWLLLAALLLTATLAIAGFRYLEAQRVAASAGSLQQFWAPVSTTRQPVLICLASPIVYQPRLNVYQKSPRFAQEFATQLDRTRHELHLPPRTSLRWSEMMPFKNFYVAGGDAYAAARYSAVMSELHKPAQVRLGDNWSLADLRNSPSVLVGAFDNDWALQLNASLPFRWVERDGAGMILDSSSAHRLWQQHWDTGKPIDTDYGLITRLLNAPTGQFVLMAGGIGPYGTEAAGNLLSDSAALATVLRELPNDWSRHNLQLVIKTTITDGVVGPAHVVAFRVW